MKLRIIISLLCCCCLVIELRADLRATPTVNRVVKLVTELTQLLNATKSPNNSAAEFSWSLSHSLSNLLYRSDCLYDLGLYINQKSVKPVHYAELNRVFRQFSLLLDPFNTKELDGIAMNKDRLTDFISSSEDVSSLVKSALIFSLLDESPIYPLSGTNRFKKSVTTKMVENKLLTRLISSFTTTKNNVYKVNDVYNDTNSVSHNTKKTTNTMLKDWIWTVNCDLKMTTLLYSRIAWLCTAGVMIEEIYLGLMEQENLDESARQELGSMPREKSLKLVYKSMSQLYDKCWSKHLERQYYGSYRYPVNCPSKRNFSHHSLLVHNALITSLLIAVTALIGDI